MLENIIPKILEQIDKDSVISIGLTGSHARGTALKYSDIDILCIVGNKVDLCPVDIQMIEGKYVVTSYITMEELENCFIDPVKATLYIKGLANLQVLWDPAYYLTEVKDRAGNFCWDENLQSKANEEFSRELVSWVEEVNKSLNGLLTEDTGLMLNGVFGLSHGLFNIVKLQRGILLDSENDLYSQVISTFEGDQQLTELSSMVFGVMPCPLKERVKAGLLLFHIITDKMMDIIKEDDKKIIDITKMYIKKELQI